MQGNTGFSGPGARRPPTLDEERDRLVPIIKKFRQDVDALIQQVPHSVNPQSGIKSYLYIPMVNEAEAQVRVHLINAKMWAGKMLEGLGNPFPAELADKADAR
jgi:hypothetical protein